MKWYKPRWLKLMQVGLSCGLAASFPLFGWIFIELNYVVIEGRSTYKNEAFYSDRRLWCILMLIFSLLIGLLSFLQKLLFSITTENLTFDFRVAIFEKLIFNSVSWFNRDERSPSNLTHILSEDVKNMHGLTIETVSTGLQLIITIIAGVIASGIFDWRMMLICLALTPIVFLGSVATNQIHLKQKKRTKKEEESAALL